MDLDKATKIFQENYKKWLNNEKRNSSGYEYERSFVEQMQKMEKELFQDSVGEVPVNRNLKKKVQTTLGKIETPKCHILSKSPARFEISGFMQETMCFLGQQLVFEQASEMLSIMKGTDVNPKQIERVCHHYGGVLEEEIQRDIKEGKIKEYGLAEKEQTHYVMTDGAMFLTREQGWKEIKMARIFKSENNVQINNDRKIIAESKYVAHLGSNKEFFPKLEYYIDHLRTLVFIGDGARWIWNWADDFYSEAVQILDYYHAAEHLHEFAECYFNDSGQKQKWLDKQKGLLMDDKVGHVIKNIQCLEKGKDKNAERKRNGLIGYYQRNRKRMMYKTFIDNGYLIGSGAIESAHRHVLQQRLKLSGQRWTMDGLQQVTNLRTIYKSKDWDFVQEKIKFAA